ncbi:TrmH family RNA methyltransferase [Polyangium sorediatum]|uniref:RNA methyltransferase n=1 Tax=Polyangium sorediatum TaxID=889274 RepID=A0ABT6P6U1_9BACT|nr:RNA methyltransferase [Polyangium sorediatum]MDI1436331.1 RNA methyltransferase [Polyangium sorediatum]
MKQKPDPRAPGAQAPEIVHGLRAGLAVFARRPDDVLAVSYGREARRDLETLIRWAAARRVPCHELRDDELERIAHTKNHEGLCLHTRPRAWLGTNELADMLVRTRGAAIALERVRNPYNIGAIVRSAAFFGLDAALLGAPAPHPGLPPDAVRVAEGGAEQLDFSRTTDLPDTLARLRARGIKIVGGESDAAANVFGFAFKRPVVLVLGHEREGLSERAKAQCDALVAIPGAGTVGSLNVSIAASVLLAEVVRENLLGKNPSPASPGPPAPAVQPARPPAGPPRGRLPRRR